MSPRHLGERAIASMVLCVAILGAACDPAEDLQNPEYRVYLDNFKKRDHAVVVEALNQLDARRGDFDCGDELEAVQRASWREAAGSVEVGQLPERRAFEDCLRGFFQASGVTQGLIQTSVVSPWVNHNFLPPIQKRLDDEVQAAQKRLDGAGCGGEACAAQTVIGDFAVPRAPAEAPRSWSEARAYCEGLDVGGLRPWRLPSKAELEAMAASNKLASSIESTTYWSGDRDFTESGTVLVWVLRFNPVSKGQANIRPERIPFTRRGLPARSKVRCVFDLSGPTAVQTSVDEMEVALTEAGCPREGWDVSVRLLQEMVVTSRAIEKGTGTAEEACDELDWCGLSWARPSAAQLAKLEGHPWLSGDSRDRCVAEIPEG